MKQKRLSKLRQRKRRKQLSLKGHKRERLQNAQQMRKARQKLTESERKIVRDRNRTRRYLKRHQLKLNLNTQDSSKIDFDQHLFECYMKNLNWYFCEVCKKKQIVSQFSAKPC